MRKWQKYILLFIVAFSIFHIIRDIFQDLGINSIFASILVKPYHSVTYNLYWTIFNTYVIAITEIVLVIICLVKNSFGKLGYAAFSIAIFYLIIWTFSWFFL